MAIRQTRVGCQGRTVETIVHSFVSRSVVLQCRAGRIQEILAAMLEEGHAKALSAWWRARWSHLTLDHAASASQTFVPVAASCKEIEKLLRVAWTCIRLSVLIRHNVVFKLDLWQALIR
jgi:hypothetical protein